MCLIEVGHRCTHARRNWLREALPSGRTHDRSAICRTCDRALAWRVQTIFPCFDSSQFSSSSSQPLTMPSSDDPYLELDLVPTENEHVKRTPTTVLLSFINEITDSGAVRDGFKLIVVGGILEASRRGLGLLLRQMYYCKSSHFLLDLAESFRLSDATIEAIFTEDDPAYRWIMGWLSVPERQSDARNFEVVSTKYQEGKDELGKAGDMEKGSAGLALIPAFGEYMCDITAEDRADARE